jgi:hypothetical protein
VREIVFVNERDCVRESVWKGECVCESVLGCG